MVDVIIRSGSKEDIAGIARVRSVAWREAYAGLVSEEALAKRTPEYCAGRFADLADALEDPDSKAGLIVAERDDAVIGFVVFGKCRDADMAGHGEIFALYILASEYGSGLGRALLEDAEFEMRTGGLRRPFALWVLEDNGRATRFYEKMGYVFDGEACELPDLGEGCYKIRMTQKYVFY